MWVGQFMGHEYGSFQSFFMVFFHGIFKAFSWLKTKKKPCDLPWKFFEKPVKMLWIYHEKFNRNFMCFDFVVPACQDFDCSLPTLPSLFVLLNRVMGAWMPCMGAYGSVVGIVRYGNSTVKPLFRADTLGTKTSVPWMAVGLGFVNY